MELTSAHLRYLLAIYEVSQTHLDISSRSIAEKLGVTKPSVSFAMKRLRENGYILMGDDNRITLTEQGEAIARRIWERHNLLTSFFIRLGVSESVARADACKIEHDLSDETFDAIRRHAQRA